MLESINIAKQSGVNLQISHIKTAGKNNWHKIDNIESIFNNALQDGIHLHCDRYPYLASSTDLDSIFPKWVYEGGIKKEINDMEMWSKRVGEDFNRIEYTKIQNEMSI